MGIIAATCVKGVSWNHVTGEKRERKALRVGRRLHTRSVDTNDARDFDREQTMVLYCKWKTKRLYHSGI